MSRPRRRSVAHALLVGLAALSLPACADDESWTTIRVEAGPGTCSVSRHTGAGPIVFWVVNVGEGTMAVSLVDSEGQVVAELDDIGPAMTMSMAANIYDGEYELLCQPTQGEGTRTSLTVG